MIVSPDVIRVTEQRGNRKSMQSLVYKKVEIRSFKVDKHGTEMHMDLRILPEWVDHDGYLTQTSLALILDVIPTVFSFASSPYHAAAVNLRIHHFSRPRLDEIIHFKTTTSSDIHNKLSNIYMEARSGSSLVATSAINIIYNKNSFWRSEKI